MAETKRQVILLGADSPIGLTIIRELGQSGILVHGLGWSRNSIGLYSKYLSTGHLREKTEAGVVEQINNLAKQYLCNWIMAVSESDLLLLERNKYLLTPVPIIPNKEQLNIVLDKQLTIDAANDVGISTPKTWRISNTKQLSELLKNFNYPLVLKWDNPHRVLPELTKRGMQVDKFKYIFNELELLDYLYTFESIGEYPLIQEYCKGKGFAQMVLMHEGEVHLMFQHRRLAEWPPEGGFSVICESVGLDCHADLMEKTVLLLKKINWSGPAMVEYRYDEETNTAILMEINGRFWGSLPLAYYSGAKFALAYFLLITESRKITQINYATGVRCRFVIPEIKRLIRILFFPDKIQDKFIKFKPFFEILNFILGFLSTKTRYYVFSIKDPKPFVMDMINIAKSILV